MYDYGLIGNCQVVSLIDHNASLNWLCLPNPDGEPVFGKLLDPDGGSFEVHSLSPARTESRYRNNTTILETHFYCADGTEFRVTDFAPRFFRGMEIFKPRAIVRKIEPILGVPKIKVVYEPITGWSKNKAPHFRLKTHLRFDLDKGELHLTSNLNHDAILNSKSFSLNESFYFVTSSDYLPMDSLDQRVEEWLRYTAQYWKTWVKHSTIPSEFQEQTIRSALTLKLCCFQETGAILAAPTTSLPEEFGSTRNWDYRFCWLRDAYFVLTALHKLNHFEEMEGFISFLLEIAENEKITRTDLCPVYRVNYKKPLPERTHPNWAGYQNSAPVRSMNQAAEHVQNDIFGELVLALTPLYFDERFYHLRSKDVDNLMKKLVEKCANSISMPDAGLWEIRDRWQEHSFSNLMCWAGLERASKLQKRGFLKDLNIDLNKSLLKAVDALNSAQVKGSIRNGPKDSTFDASLLLLPVLRFPDQKLCQDTVLQIWDNLKLREQLDKEAFIYRYKRVDDFGRPQSAFLICSFWLIQGLAAIGEKKKARELFTSTQNAANKLGLFAEHFNPDNLLQSGNFPQAYSHVGQINSAFAISIPWEDII